MGNNSDAALIKPRLIVGLGNPEPRYERTRHNIGFAVIDALQETWGFTGQEQRRFQGWLGAGLVPSADKLFLLKPTTYMNRSGQSVRAVLDWYKLAPTSVLVIYDDMDLPVGRLRLRLSGSAGGHNGMKSIIAHLGTQEFPRLRVGIDRGEPGQGTVGHVLGKFAPAEAQAIARLMPVVVDAVTLSVRNGVAAAMNRYNSYFLSE